jgi:hypothetical protein
MQIIETLSCFSRYKRWTSSYDHDNAQNKNFMEGAKS